MKTILIVDDLASVRFYHKMLVSQAGFTALTAADGMEALAVLEKNPIDLVILDLLMPRMSGAEFLVRARASKRYDGLPVLVISSEAQKEITATMATSGNCEILKKPILPDALMAAIHRLIG